VVVDNSNDCDYSSSHSSRKTVYMDNGLLMSMFSRSTNEKLWQFRYRVESFILGIRESGVILTTTIYGDKAMELYERGRHIGLWIRKWIMGK
jgi:hypothetical protein